MKYYKTTNREETHNGLQYHDGLNVDVLPFDPDGSCKPGGIYFSREDILAFPNYWLREVTIPDGEEIYQDPQPPRKWKAHQVILGKRRKFWTVANIQRLLRDGADPKAYDSEALLVAARQGHLAIVKLLLPVSDQKALESLALRWAARHGHLAIVKLLLPVSDPKAYESAALRWAARNGHHKVVAAINEYIQKGD